MLGRPVGVSLAVVLVVGVVPAGIGATPADGPVANEPPLVDAGLDQQVQYGATVRLDATGSRDPDGEIVSYEWSIERPNGTTIEPECPSCDRTSFRPASVGTYDVTLTVTDDSGTTRSDTLYVEVEAGAGPSVSLSGPTEPETGTASAYTATVSAGDQPVDRITWFIDGRQKNRTAASAGNATGWLKFTSTATRNVTVSVTDEAGKRTTDSLTVRPRAESNPMVTASGGSGDDRSVDGKYSSERNVWLENGGVNTYEQAVTLAKGNTNELPERVVGGLNDDEAFDRSEGSGELMGDPAGSGGTDWDETTDSGEQIAGAERVDSWTGG